jgi:hypothetical protein
MMGFRCIRLAADAAISRLGTIGGSRHGLREGTGPVSEEVQWSTRFSSHLRTDT